jgi:ubiquinone/menaquinone biosynthesis C-methylase UbiE
MMSDWAGYYDRLAQEYDAMTAHSGWSVNRAAADLLAPLDLAPAHVLDLAAGTGQTALMLHDHYPEAALTLVDPSAGMMEQARGKLPGARLVVADATSFLGRTDGTWDLVAALGFLELVPDVSELLRLAVARLAPGGHLVASHEPLLDDGTVQSRPVSRISGGLEIHRRTSEEIQRHAATYGLVRVASHLDTAFLRTDGDGRAIYELVVWRRSAPSGA